MTTGEQLKTNLGLSNLRYVRINRPVGTNVKILFVWYDSYRYNMPITHYRIRKYPWVATLFIGTAIMQGSNRKAIFTPAMDIEIYNGRIHNAVIIPVDLAGDRFIDTKQFTKKFESVEKLRPQIVAQFNKTLDEFVTLADLADAGNVSDFTMTWRKDRNRVMGAENTTAKLIDVFVNEADKSVTFGFLTSATELGDKEPSTSIDSDYRFYDGPKKELDPDSFDLKANPSKTYTVEVKILEFFDWLDVFKGEKIGPSEMKEILRVSNVQIFSSAPSFNFQGFAYWLTQIDASIVPQTIKPKQWDKFHGDGAAFLDKHLYGLLRQFQFFINPMASMLSKRLKDRGLI